MKHRIHRDEMKRFADSEDGTLVWFKRETDTRWRKTREPRWHKDSSYILDNKYAELRKEGIDKDRPIQVYSTIYSEWVTPISRLQFDIDIKNYRLEPKEEEEFKYPIYKRCRARGYIVEFTSKKEGVIIKDTEISRSVYRNIGHKSNGWIPHTDTETWEDYDYVEPIYYYRWEKLSSNNKIRVSDLISDKYAEKNGYREEGWVKRTNTKRTWKY